MNKNKVRGISLIEILVAMAIGLVVVGAVLSTYLHSRAGSRQSMAQSQVTEDAAIAFGVLRNHVGMAGYSQPTGFSASGMARRLTGPAIVGCDGGFASGEGFAAPQGVSCNANPGTSADSLIVRYEADYSNSPKVTSATGTVGPADCRGFALVQGPAAPLDYWVSDSRFSIDPNASGGPALQCRGSGGMATLDVNSTAAATTPFGDNASLAINIEDMQISYGVTKDVTNASGDTVNGKRVTAYVTASDVGAPSNANNWGKVVSVRICLLVRSEEEVLDQPTPYLGCSNNAGLSLAPAPNDRRIHRAFVTTIALQNRL